MKIGVYPGSFDPFTLGHLDITNRASKLFDNVVIGVLNNAVKKQALFTVDERVDMLKLKALADFQSTLQGCVKRIVSSEV